MDILQLLEEARPTEPPTAEHLATVRAQLLAVATPSVRRTRQRRSRLRWAAPLVAAIAVSGGAVAWATTHQDPSTTYTIECGSADTFIPAQSGNPIADCRGQLAQQMHSVPSLSGWVTPSGMIAVLPSGQEPPAGSAPLPTGFSQNRSILYVSDMLNDLESPIAAQCTTRDTAVTYARRQLDIAGLVGWSVVTATGTASSNCTGYTDTIDVAAQTVTLHGVVVGGAGTDATSPDVELDGLLHQQLNTTVGPRCLSLEEAAALASRDAAELGIADDALTITQAGSIGAASLSCATPTVVPAGGIDVVLWAVAPVTTADGSSVP